MRTIKSKLPETPEQREIRLLKARVMREKKNTESVRKLWLEETMELKKAQEQLFYAGKLIKLYEDRVDLRPPVIPQGRSIVDQIRKAMHELRAEAREQSRKDN